MNFVQIDAEAILRIPINTGEDFWAWQPDKRGQFSVRSAYKLLIEHHGRSGGASSLSNGLGLYGKSYEVGGATKG